MILGGVIAVVSIGIVIFFIIRHRRNKAWAEEYALPFSGLDDDENMNYIKDDTTQFTKEQAREKFLDNYNAEDYENEYEEIEEPKRKRHKAKRYK